MSLQCQRLARAEDPARSRAGLPRIQRRRGGRHGQVGAVAQHEGGDDDAGDGHVGDLSQVAAQREADVGGDSSKVNHHRHL